MSYLARRSLEILPAALTWTALLFPVVFALLAPAVVAIFVISFDLYWLFKAILMGVHTLFGFLHIQRDNNIDWLKRCYQIRNLRRYEEELQDQLDLLLKKYPLLRFRFLSWLFYKVPRKEYLFLKSTLQEISELKNQKIELGDWSKIYHLILLACYKEPLETLEASIRSYIASDYPLERLILVLAMEERAGKEAHQKAEILRERYGSKFFAFLVSFHPDNLPGEVKAKGANVDWAARNVIKPFLDNKNIPYNEVIISTFDADTRVHPRYFACLTYKYLTTPKRNRRSFQPIPLYSNNIWEAPALMRVVAWGASFWQMIESTRTYRLTNFSSHAMSFQMLVDIDFWDKTVVNEDSRQFWRAYFAFNGDHKVIPVFTPVYMDAVLSKTYLGTFKNQYKQKQRWAYGVEHFPFIVMESLKNKKIPPFLKWSWVFRTLEGYFSWATASVFIATAGWMPILLNPAFRLDILFLSFPVLAGRILLISWIGIVGAMLISLKLLPPRPRHYGWARSLMVAVQWVLMPFSVLIFGSLPAIDAQTRLALGKYLEFWTTEKAVFKNKR